ncbi:hypothetical protein [Pilimelia anulata]|uniref:hypothetical protein n=1 Tax=Pilimelia anulata TaxID=53371 RepID=UPI0016693BA5|nr:hypothetical protein [Pilimelia anulata]
MRSHRPAAGRTGRAISDTPPARALAAAAVAVAVLAPGAPAAAAAGTKVCAATDDRLSEISGLVATAKGYIVINDSTELEERKRVFYLDAKCRVKDTVAFPTSPRDPEDLALSPDGKTLWIADTGDNDGKRETVAVWRMPVDGKKPPELYRLTYPDGAKDAEALLVGRDGLPVLVTKGSKALVYLPAGPLRKGAAGTALKRVGEVAVPRTTTATALGVLGRLVITGGAAAPGGGRVALRTYADAFEWDVPDGDIVKAIIGGKPRVTPLPDEPWGESLAYTPDGQRYLTISETAQDVDLKPTIQSYAPAAVTATAPPAATADRAKPGLLSSLSLADITKIVAGVGVLGLILVGVGVLGITRARRKRRAESGPAADQPAERDQQDRRPVPAGAAAVPAGAAAAVGGPGAPGAGPRGGPGAGPRGGPGGGRPRVGTGDGGGRGGPATPGDGPGAAPRGGPGGAARGGGASRGAPGGAGRGGAGGPGVGVGSAAVGSAKPRGGAPVPGKPTGSATVPAPGARPHRPGTPAQAPPGTTTGNIYRGSRDPRPNDDPNPR